MSVTEVKIEVNDEPSIDESLPAVVVLPSEPREPIKLVYIAGTAFVFNVEDIAKLRLTHRIVGESSGVCQPSGRKDRKTPPLRLRYEETRFLLGRNFAKLFRPSNLDFLPDVERMRIQEHYDRHLHKYMAYEKLLTKIQLTEGRKLDSKYVTQADPPEFNRKNHCTIVPIDSTIEIESDQVDLEEFRKTETPRNDVVSKVFEDLWTKGKYVASGSNYAVDLTVYNVDPADNHSFGCVKCLTVNEKIPAIDIVRQCRLARSLRKNFIVASSGDDSVKYLTLSWEA